jgi:histidine triad (HIT) family protein
MSIDFTPKHISYEEFLKYGPQKNKFRDLTKYEGTLYHHHGSEAEYVLQLPASNIWTLYYDGEVRIRNGDHQVQGTIGYFHSSTAHDENSTIIVDGVPRPGIPPKMTVDDTGLCPLCPLGWKFKYALNSAKDFGKHDLTYLPELYAAQKEEDLPSDLREKYAGSSANVIYLDDQLAIFEEVHKDAPTHLLVIPVEHVSRLDVLKDPQLLTDILSAANKLTELADIKEAVVVVSTKQDEYEYVPHFHAHIQATTFKEPDELRSLLYPGFYKDSKFYVQHQERAATNA